MTRLAVGRGALSGLGILWGVVPRAMPWARMERAVGPREWERVARLARLWPVFSDGRRETIGGIPRRLWRELCPICPKNVPIPGFRGSPVDWVENESIGSIMGLLRSGWRVYGGFNELLAGLWRV